MLQAKKSILERMYQQNTERKVTLKRGKNENFGFALECANEDGGEFRAETDYPTLHKIARIVPNSHAYKASLRNGDYVIEINGQDVKSTLYKQCVHMIQNTGDTLTLKIIPYSTNINVSTPSLVRALTRMSINESSSKSNSYIDIPEFLEASRSIHVTTIHDDMPLIVQCFEFLKPYCEDLNGSLDTVFNTIVDEILTEHILLSILTYQMKPADALTSYVVDSLKRQNGLNDIIWILSELPNLITDDHMIQKFKSFADQMTKRMLLVQTLENMSCESQRFLCNLIRKNDLPIPLSYRSWSSSDQRMK